ncbi:MAG: efflux RND transporter periplasmic adaptor subunit [Opitutales bacterium]|nr:efflux RND transporter periplasmic adaptor subunit [Opitutales bacterium]
MNINHPVKVSIFLVFISIFLFSSCGKKQPEIEAVASARPIKLFTVEQVSSEQSKSFPASIASAKSRELAFQVGGKIAQIPVKESSELKKGDLIAELDKTDIQTQLDSAKALFENAKTEFERAERLLKEDAISQSTFDQRKSQFETAKAQFDTAEKALADASLYAPFDGVVAQIMFEELDLVQPGASVVSFIDGESLEAIISVPADLVAMSESRTGVKSYLSLGVAPDLKIPVEFNEARLIADSSTQTYMARFVFDAPEGLLVLPGMTATVFVSSRAVSENDSEIVSVPLTSIVTEKGETYVWKVDLDSMTVSKTKIIIKDSFGEFIQVLEGLSVGDTIANAGVSYLSEGLKVREWGNK